MTESHPHKPWRTDPAFNGFGHPSYPDDFRALFILIGETVRALEDMWVRLSAVVPRPDGSGATLGYRGTLLNQPHTPAGLAKGAKVLIRWVPGQKQPYYVSPVALANLRDFECQCRGCGFDMHPFPLTEVAAAQFPDVADGFLPVQFTTGCPVCPETMLVTNRSAAMN